MEPTAQDVVDLRSRILQKLESEHGSAEGSFHPADMSRILDSDDWLNRILVHHDLDMKEALNMVFEACQWRKDNKVNEICEQNINMDYMKEGHVFVRNRDLDGKSLLIFKWKKHVKGKWDFEEIKRCVIYWFERLERMNNGDQITLFFDMADSGLNNVDMEFTKYLIGLCKLYYPNFLNNILIFEMPWILNAAFRAIKAWLPAKGVAKLKFVQKSNLKEYVSVDQALASWGGRDSYVFEFEPESADSLSARFDDSKKKVHFADGSPTTVTSPSGFGDIKSEEGFPNSEPLLQITPSDHISFSQEWSSDLSGSAKITNIADSITTFKMKTTSPEKFRVRPSYGVLAPNASQVVNVSLQPGYSAQGLIREKFLILSFRTDVENPSDVAELWKNVEGKEIHQTRLKCVLGTSSQNGSAYGVTSSSRTTDTDSAIISQLLSAVNHLTESNEKIRADNAYNRLLLKISMFFIVLLGVGLFFVMKTVQTMSPKTNAESCEMSYASEYESQYSPG
ncbi:motile sperm domain-containing protein 2 isoform X2 [Nilaparvata lugens]|uniref:motile sperm domain-containing protein 2 isoform X1 n=1 Tax=Nilaparvata lugens TaxID=108931 RepID=UPI00193D17AA|nr:motile sperm domain-containing protein 2 isoform X1 [Nilaparvata lugens]XP_039287228.1 motile sperm domain-containing protein 2 isoform X2 [Nilaparvata lugens]